MKKFIYIVLSLILAGTTFCLAQDPFVPSSFSTNAKIENPSNFCELPNSKFLFIATKSNLDSTAFVFITDKYGNVEKSKFLIEKSDSTDYGPISCFVNDDFTVSVIGINIYWNDATASKVLWFAKIDTNLNLIGFKENIITNSDTQLSHAFSFVKILDAYYGAIAYYRTPDFKDLKTQLIKMNINGEILQRRELNKSFFGNDYEETKGISTITISSDKFHLLFSSVADGYITKVDTNFNIVDTIKCNPTFYTAFIRDTGFGSGQTTCIEISEGNLIIGSQIQAIYSGVRSQWGILKYDQHKKEINRFGIFPKKDDSLIISYQNAAGVNIANRANAIYTLGFTIGYGNKGYIVVSKFDSSANPIWIKYLGDKVHKYWPNSMAICKDGSLLVCAYSDSASLDLDYNARSQDFYIVRLDSATGNPLSIRNISEQLRNGISIYPNPATNKINFKGASIGCQVIFFDLSGKLVKSEKLIINNASIDIQSLPIGNYSYQIIKPDGHKLSSGIFVKQ